MSDADDRFRATEVSFGLVFVTPDGKDFVQTLSLPRDLLREEFAIAALCRWSAHVCQKLHGATVVGSGRYVIWDALTEHMSIEVPFARVGVDDVEAIAWVLGKTMPIIERFR